DAALLAKDGQPREADAVLERFLRDEPDEINLVMMRAQIRADSLEDTAKARELLQAVADRSDSSAPVVQLAGLELDQNRLHAAAALVAKIRARWKEAAAADLPDPPIPPQRPTLADA